MDKINQPKTIIENILQQNEKINEVIDIVNNFEIDGNIEVKFTEVNNRIEEVNSRIDNISLKESIILEDISPNEVFTAVDNIPDTPVTPPVTPDTPVTPPVTPDTPEVTSFTITNNLTNTTTNNSNTTIREGESYSATLTPDVGYELDSVTILMGNVDITSTSYSNGVINIENVTGNITINVTSTIVSSGEPSDAVKVYIENNYIILNNVPSLLDLGPSKFTANSYSNETYQIYGMNSLPFFQFINLNSSLPMGENIPPVPNNGSNSLLNNTTEGNICGVYGNNIQLRLYKDLGGFSSVEEYLQNQYGEIRFALVEGYKEKIINPSLITSMSINVNNNGLQYAQFSYSDPPTSNIYKGVNSIFIATGTNANLSNVSYPTAAISTTKLSIAFPPNTFSEFTIENVRQYLTTNTLIFWYV